MEQCWSASRLLPLIPIPDLRELLRAKTKEGSFFPDFQSDFMSCGPNPPVLNRFVFPNVRLTVNETTDVSLVMKVSGLSASVDVNSGEALSIRRLRS